MNQIDIHKILNMNKGKKFDVVLQNPPYDEKNQLYIDFLNKCMNITNYMVCICPVNGFFARKRFSKNKEFNKNIDLYKPTLDIGDWQGFDAAPLSNSCVSTWNLKEPCNEIIINFNEKTVKAKNVNDMVYPINDYLKEFYIHLNEYLKTHASFYDHIVENPKNAQYFEKKGKEKIVKDIDHNSYYVYMPYIIAAFSNGCWIGKYDENIWNGPAKVFIAFNNYNNALNMFKSIALYGKENSFNNFYKLIMKIDEAGYFAKEHKCRYEYMPMFDFSKSYTEEELFNMIGMKYDKDEIEKILNDK